MSTEPNIENIASYIDHTILNADASRADIERICAEAAKYELQVGLREPTLGFHGDRRAGRLRRADLLGDRLPVRCHDHRIEGL